MANENIPLLTEHLYSDEFILNMGPQHPSTHGVLRLLLRMDGEVVKDLVPVVGYIHRGMEKLFENRKYEQIIPFTDRTDYLSAMCNNFAYVLAVEKLLAVEIPQRAEYIRVIMAELNRIMSHLLWFAAYCLDVGAFTPFLYAFREREEIVAMVEEASGGRLTYNYFRIGGFKYDLTKEFFRRLKIFAGHFEKKIRDYEVLLIDNVIFKSRTKGIGVLSGDKAVSYGVTGPSLRGSARYDVRKDKPYSVYPSFDFDIPCGKNGDTWDRCMVRMEEMRESLKILKQAMEGFPEGDVRVKGLKNIKPEPGEAYASVEGPRGDIGFYIVSDGSAKPARVKMRKPSFSNLSALKEIIAGLKIADLVAIMGSLDLVIPEIDR